MWEEGSFDQSAAPLLSSFFSCGEAKDWRMDDDVV